MSDEELSWLEGGAPRRLGIVVGGSLGRGLDVRLDPGASVEETKAGTFVTVQGGWYRFFGIITDLSLESADPRFAASAAQADPAMVSVLSGTSAYAMARVTPMLVTSAAESSPQPARSLPGHFAPVQRASEADVRAIFGSEDERHIFIGSPLDMEDARVCLDLGELVKRSNGVFGKSGTGKSFLTRILLAGILQKGLATNLVFDMHNEYGWQGTSETQYSVRGLRQLFGNQVAVFTLDAASSRRRGLTPDYEASIGYDEIEPEDVAILAPSLGITELGAQASYPLAQRFGDDWMGRLLELSREELQSVSEEVREHPGTLDALRRRLRQLERFDFLIRRRPEGRGTVGTIMDHLDRGIHVVLEFGRYSDDLTAYLLVANLITRRVHQRYRARTEQALAENAAGPRPLVITIEEAHRFLGPQVAGQTIFGTIAREMRKYNVTLLVVDQRPSGIDDEVLSQIGTRFTCLLDNERDVDAVLTGSPRARELKGVLSGLEPQQQALILGHAVPMPVVVRTRTYGEDFYAEMTGFHGNLPAQAQRQRDREDLFGRP
jgi:DNA helicase HerA-like ATPase